MMADEVRRPGVAEAAADLFGIWAADADDSNATARAAAGGDGGDGQCLFQERGAGVLLAGAGLGVGGWVRFVTHCCSMPRTVLVRMYSVRPAGTKTVKTVNMTGIIVVMAFCCGSTGAGLSTLLWTYISAPVTSGSTKYGSAAVRSGIQNMRTR